MPLKLRRRIDPRYWLASFVVIATIAAALTAWTLEPNLEVPSATDELLRHVKFLASAELTGRGVDTPGIKLAGDYIAADFAKSGLQPGGDNGSFRQPFDVAVGVTVVEPSSLTLGNSAPLQLNEQWIPLGLSTSDKVAAEVVFAGYGLTAAGKAAEGYNSYTGLDVTNKIVLVLRYVPENVEPKRRQELNLYAALRYKALVAREHGAKAILVVTGPNSPNPGALVPLSSDGSLSGSDIIAVSITTNVADALVAGSGKDLSSLQTALDSENPHAER